MFSFVDILKKNIMSAEYKHFRRKIHKSCVGKKTRILGYKFLPFHSGRILFNACPVESKHKLNLWRRPTKNEEQNYKMHAENVDVRVRPPTLVFFCLTRTNSGLGTLLDRCPMHKNQLRLKIFSNVLILIFRKNLILNVFNNFHRSFFHRVYVQFSNTWII